MIKLSTMAASWARRVGLDRTVDRLRTMRENRAVHTAQADGFVFRATHEQRHHLASITRAEPLTVELFKAALRPGMTVIDVGAFLGHFTLLAARTVGPAGRVISIEADPRNLRSVKDNVAANGFGDRVDVIQGAATSVDAPVTFFRDPRDPAQHSLFPRLGTDATQVVVAGHRLDSLAPAADIVKSDAEGAEMSVLDGMGSLLGSTPVLFLELHPAGLARAGHGPRDLGDRLGRAGYRVDVLDERSGRRCGWDDPWDETAASLNLHARLI